MEHPRGMPPRGARAVGDVEVDDLASLVAQNDKDEEHPKSCRRHGEEVGGDEIREVVL